MAITDQNRESAIAKYAKDNAEADGRVFEVTLSCDHDVESCISRGTWDDGVPVTKEFHRNDPVDLHLPKGTVLKGVVYRGRASGCLCFDFPYGRAWYSIMRMHAESLTGIDWSGDGEDEEEDER